jgi:RecJ-like exonuclease
MRHVEQNRSMETFRRKKKLCSRCSQERDRPGQRYCRACHAKYMRETRPPHSQLSPEAKSRANARAKLNTYVRRGVVKRPETCSSCGGDGPIEGHHEDYSKALEVIWLCRTCHRSLHASIGYMSE